MANFTFNINDFYDDRVWDLICDGRTKGVFQLESQLGRSWAKRVSPRNINELSALISLIRPGCLKAFTDGKSMTQHYVDRKANLDPVVYPDDSLEHILQETYGVLVYQEQSMMIAQELAGFSLKEADSLRKAIGKKKAGLMAEVKKSFLSGAKKKAIVTKGVAEEIFSWIEKSNRYAFNKSHAVSYAMNAYWSAYCKCYRPVKFFKTYLNHAKRKPDPKQEIKELVTDAKMNDIEVYPPRLKHLYKNFQSVSKTIYFGINNDKQVGEVECDKINRFLPEAEEILHKTIDNWNWLDILNNLCSILNKQAVIALISVGAFNGKNNNKNRNEMLYEFDSWKQLSPREQKYIKANYHQHDTLIECMDDMINNLKINSRRLVTVADIKNSLENPFYDIKDDPVWIAETEEKYMGCALTCGKTDYIQSAIVNTICKDIALGYMKGKVNVAVQINSLREYKTKKGKNPGQLMAFLSVEDSSGVLDSVIVFPEDYQKNKEFLVEGNMVILMGQTSKKEDGGIIVNKVCQI